VNSRVEGGEESPRADGLRDDHYFGQRSRRTGGENALDGVSNTSVIAEGGEVDDDDASFRVLVLGEELSDLRGRTSSRSEGGTFADGTRSEDGGGRVLSSKLEEAASEDLYVVV
jgi:hypothetical protein